MFAAAATTAAHTPGMDPAWVGMFYLAGRFFLAVVLACGGIYSLRKGFELIVTHVGRRKEEAEIKFWKLEANVRTVGSVVMVTACIWGYLGYLVSVFALVD